MRSVHVLIGSLAVCGLVAAARIAGSTQVDHTFAYQGQMRNAGQLLTGPVDLRISLWDAEAGGGQVGTTNQFNGLPLFDGRFSCGLNFGSEAFDGSNRWIQVEFRPTAGSGEYIAMAPRDKVSATPYALYALNSGAEAAQQAQQAALAAVQAAYVAMEHSAMAQASAAVVEIWTQQNLAVYEQIQAVFQSLSNTSRGLGITVSAPPGGEAVRAFNVSAPCLLLVNCSGQLPLSAPRDQVELRVEVDGNPIELSRVVDSGSSWVVGFGNACVPLQPGAHEIRLVATSSASKGSGKVTLTAHLVMNALE